MTAAAALAYFLDKEKDRQNKGLFLYGHNLNYCGSSGTDQKQDNPEHGQPLPKHTRENEHGTAGKDGQRHRVSLLRYARAYNGLKKRTETRAHERHGSGGLKLRKQGAGIYPAQNCNKVASSAN